MFEPKRHTRITKPVDYSKISCFYYKGDALREAFTCGGGLYGSPKEFYLLTVRSECLIVIPSFDIHNTYHKFFLKEAQHRGGDLKTNTPYTHLPPT